MLGDKRPAPAAYASNDMLMLKAGFY